MTANPWEKPRPPLRPYSGNHPQTCRKCGAEGIPTSLYCNEVRFDGELQREWLRRSCHACGYAWLEATINTEKTPE